MIQIATRKGDGSYMPIDNNVFEKHLSVLRDWIVSCVRKKRLARNTVAVGIVILDRLRDSCPVAEQDVISPGGELIGARSRLRSTLRKYGVQKPEKYLKEVTTRQAAPDGKRLFEAFQYGHAFADLTDSQRDELLVGLIKVLVEKVDEWFDRQNLKIGFERQNSPIDWIHTILVEAKGKSGGIVEQHLVGAKLQERHDDMDVPNFPSHAADVQTGRVADFLIGKVAYHVTAAPTPDVIAKCGENIQSGLHPILLVPSELVGKTRSFAEYARLEKKITVTAIEDFIALNIIEMSSDRQSEFFDVLQKIIDVYNVRLESVETDMSLRIEVK